MGDDGAGLRIGPDRVVPSQIVGVSASVIFPCIIKSRRFLGPAHPCSPGKRAIKWIYTPKNCLQRDIFLTDIVGYDQLKLYLKIYTPKMKSWVCCCPLWCSEIHGLYHTKLAMTNFNWMICHCLCTVHIWLCQCALILSQTMPTTVAT